MQDVVVDDARSRSLEAVVARSRGLKSAEVLGIVQGLLTLPVDIVHPDQYERLGTAAAATGRTASGALAGPVGDPSGPCRSAGPCRAL